jgi:hypothetical protein
MGGNDFSLTGGSDGSVFLVGVSGAFVEGAESFAGVVCLSVELVLAFAVAVVLGSSFGGNMSRIPPIPATTLRIAVAPTFNCLLVRRASNPADGFGVGASGAGAETGGGVVAGFAADGVLAAGLAASGFGGAAAGAGVGEPAGAGSGMDRGNVGLPGTSTAIGSVIRDPLLLK